LDINVRIPANRFQIADRILAERFERKPNPSYPNKFSCFKDDSLPIPVGIQLTVMDSEFCNFLLQNSEFGTAYNQIKQKFNGEAIAAYHVAKSEFIESIISRDDFQKL